MTEKQLKLLGLKATDPVTGMAGVITSICFDINGCIQACLTPPVNKEGAYGQAIWIDIQRLKIVDDKPVCSVSDFKTQTGCALKPNK